MWPGPTASIMMGCVDSPRTLLHNIHNHVCTTLYGVLTQTTLWILTTASTSNPIPKNLFITEMLKEISDWENWIIEEQYIYFHTVFNITYFSHQLCILLYITSQIKLRKEIIFDINTYFTIRITHDKFQSSATIIPQGNLTSDHEIKQHI